MQGPQWKTTAMAIDVARMAEQLDSRFRRRLVPLRAVGDEVVVARPSDGEALLLAGAAAHIWALVEVWCTEADLEQSLAELFPDIDGDERSHAVSEVLMMLSSEGLIERSES